MTTLVDFAGAVFGLISCRETDETSGALFFDAVRGDIAARRLSPGRGARAREELSLRVEVSPTAASSGIFAVADGIGAAARSGCRGASSNAVAAAMSSRTRARPAGDADHRVRGRAVTATLTGTEIVVGVTRERRGAARVERSAATGAGAAAVGASATAVWAGSGSSWAISVKVRSG